MDTSYPEQTLELPITGRGELREPEPSLPCAFCPELAPSRRLEEGALRNGHGWACACGARGAEVALYDLDETFEDLCTTFGLPPGPPPSQPPPPVGTSGLLHATGYDGPVLLRDLIARAAAAGFRLRSGALVLRYLPDPPLAAMERRSTLVWCTSVAGLQGSHQRAHGVAGKGGAMVSVALPLSDARKL